VFIDVCLFENVAENLEIVEDVVSMHNYCCSVTKFWNFTVHVFQMPTQRALVTTLRQRQNKWFGRVLRHDSLLKKVIEERMRRSK